MRKRKSRRTPVNVNYLLVFSDFLYAKKNHQRSPKKSLVVIVIEKLRLLYFVGICAYQQNPSSRSVISIHLFGSHGWTAQCLRQPSLLGLHSVYSTSIEYTPNEFATRWLLYHITKPSAVSIFHFPILDGEADFGIDFSLLRDGLT